MFLMDELNSMDDEYVVEEYKPKIDPTLSEIQECCKNLGINKASDPELEYIAIELLRSPIPKDWKFYRNRKNPSSFFFYNPSTKTIQMQHPLYQTYLNMYNSEKQKKIDSYNSNSESDDIIENDKEIEKLKQSHQHKINLLKKQQQVELDNLIAELDTTNSKKLKKCVTARDKYQLALQRYVDYSEDNRIRMDEQISDIEKAHLQKIAELKKKNDDEIKELKEQCEKIKKEAEIDLKRLQKGIEKRKEEEMKKFEKQLDDDKAALVHKKFKRKFKFFSSKPIFINSSKKIKLKRSKPISLDILDDYSENPNPSSAREISDKTSIQSETEIPPFSFNFNQFVPQKKKNNFKKSNTQGINNNFNNNFIDIDTDTDNSDTSSSEVPPFLSTSRNRNWLIKESDKVELQMGKTVSNFKESLGSTYNTLTTDFNGIKDFLDKQLMDLNKNCIEYQQKTLEMNKELNSAISEVNNMNRMALNTINSLQASLTPRVYYQPFPQTSLTPQPRRTHAIPGTFDSDDNKGKNRNRNKSKNRNKNNDFDDNFEYDYGYEKNKTKKRHKSNNDDYYDDRFPSYDSPQDYSDLTEKNESDELQNTTGMKKLKKFNDIFISAQKTQARVNNDFRRAKQQLYE